MKRSFNDIVEKVIKQSDIVLEVLDARLIAQTRNVLVEDMVAEHGKKLIVAVNKSDLVPYEYVAAQTKKIPNAIFISGKKHLGTSFLREEIMKNAPKRDQIIVGVVGYPNTGKSTVINALKGKGAAPVSSQSGWTKGKQLIRISQKLFLLDTPGVIPFEQDDPIKLAILASKNPQQIKDPDLVAGKMLQILLDQGLADQIEQRYNVTVLEQDEEELLEDIARARNKLLSGGRPDIMTVSRQIIHDWQRGELLLKQEE